MVNSTRTSSASAPASFTEPPSAILRPPSWLHSSLEDSTHALMVNRVRDVCNGVTVALQLVHSSTLDHSTGGTPILSVNDTERMLLLAMTSAKMLGEQMELEIEFLNECAEQRGAAA